ncbi:MAG: hypothetical protein J0H65_13135 [Rhizobiales bacterium]|nr:hypothetical protein [Hyphomicrobiales bacterium]
MRSPTKSAHGEMLPLSIDHFSDLDCIACLDPMVANIALDLRMFKQELDGAKIPVRR